MATARARDPRESRRPGIVHRYWRLAAVLALLTLGAVYLPNPRSSGAGRAERAPSQAPPAAVNSRQGDTVAGINCTPKTRQIPWSNYADYCLPAWQGGNGGSTAHGVTSSTITLTYRTASSSALDRLYSQVPASVIGTNAQTIATMKAYIRVFNKYFELYGRHVVLRTFTGKSDFLAEDSGLDAPQAQADAATAYDAGGFADMSLVGSSQLYESDLASNGVIAISLYLGSQSWYRSRAPFAYSTGPNCDEEASTAAAILSTSVAGVPATDTGGTLTGLPGKIGIIYPEGGQSHACASAIADDLRQRGVSGVSVLGYSFNLASLVPQAQSIMAAMASSDVTTVVCSSCDPITPQFLAKAAVAEDYQPQWYVEPAFSPAGSDDDSFVRLLPSEVSSHLLQLGTPSRPKSQQEAYRALKLSGIKSSQITPTYPSIYAQLLMFFDALQNAGPDLTPQSFERGIFDIPASSPGGQFGQWKGRKGVFGPQRGYQIMHWDPSARSAQDGRIGAFLPCKGSHSYLYGEAHLAGLTPKRPLDCTQPKVSSSGSGTTAGPSGQAG